jgi:hypothetical protein
MAARPYSLALMVSATSPHAVGVDRAGRRGSCAAVRQDDPCSKCATPRDAPVNLTEPRSGGGCPRRARGGYQAPQ